MAGILSGQLERFAVQAYAERKPYLERLAESLDQELQACAPQERTLLQFLYGTMPLSDAGEVPFEVLLGYVRHGLYLRSEVSRCRELPEAVFLKYVLYHRVNSERITDCRRFFYEQVKERIEGLPLREAALELNYWCAEHATYQAADQRTLAPYYVYTSGSGRCGEESAFVVSVLRAAGIPARQVYAPRWAHCDDNHAWVEFLLEDGWHYMGACEPEEVTDKGWFDGAASRAVVIHTMNFTAYGEEEERAAGIGEELIGRENGVYYYNRTPAYAVTKPFTVSVGKESGESAAGADVYIELLNMAEYTPVAHLTADENGEVSARLGLGTVRVRVSSEGGSAVCWINTAQTDRIALCLQTSCAGDISEWQELEILASVEKILHPARQTQEQIGRNRVRLEQCAKRREERAVCRREEAKRVQERQTQEERAEGEKSTATAEHALRKLLLSVLADKDLRDLPEEAAADALTATRYRGSVPEEIFALYLLNQRIYFEELTPYRRRILEFLSEKEADRLRLFPEEIALWADTAVRDVPELDYRTIYASPVGVLATGYANPVSRRILETAVCRALGIPARIDPVTMAVEYYDREAGRFLSLEKRDRPQEEMARLTLTGEARQLQYGVHWTMARQSEENGEFETLRLEGSAQEQDVREGQSLLLEPGTYRVIVTARRPDGGQRAAQRFVFLRSGEQRSLELHLPEISLRDMFVESQIEDFALETEAGEQTTLFSFLRGHVGAAVFLEPGREPSEHVMNELRECVGKWNPQELPIVLILSGRQQLGQETLAGLLREMPGVTVCICRDFAIASSLARRFYVDPEKLPLLMLFREDGTGIYGCSGYNVGSVALTLRLAQIAGEKE
ncbi:MAG: transglutaminase-like domain-containing protein [Eubacteriales bacterium]|nr:transglutaminase-like domain-containing protein [Eubacteriales bacterium]